MNYKKNTEKWNKSKEEYYNKLNERIKNLKIYNDKSVCEYFNNGLSKTDIRYYENLIREGKKHSEAKRLVLQFRTQIVKNKLSRLINENNYIPSINDIEFIEGKNNQKILLRWL